MADERRRSGDRFDPKQAADLAYNAGRDGSLPRVLDKWRAWVSGKAITPTIVYDRSRAAAFLQKIAADTDRPMQDATILLTGVTVKTTPSQIGRNLDVNATLGLLRAVILNLNTGAEIQLIIHDTPPPIKEAGKRRLDRYAPRFRLPFSCTSMVRASLPLAPGRSSPEFISGMIAIKRADNADGTAYYDVSANFDPLRTIIQGLSAQLKVDPVSARFVFNDTTKQLETIKDSVNGRTLDVDATLKTLQSTLFRIDNRRVALVFQEVVPPVNSRATAQSLGITEQIVSATTHFYGSTESRRTNIQVAAARFHGLVIAPGEVFSFDKYLGDVSPRNRLRYGAGHLWQPDDQGRGRRRLPGKHNRVSGGVFCRIPDYQPVTPWLWRRLLQSPAGDGQRDAVLVGRRAGRGTVYSPEVDFKFTNDTPYYLLIETYFDPATQSLTFKLYSTSTGRVVTKEGPTIGNPVAHGRRSINRPAISRQGRRARSITRWMALTFTSTGQSSKTVR